MWKVNKINVCYSRKDAVISAALDMQIASLNYRDRHELYCKIQQYQEAPTCICSESELSLFLLWGTSIQIEDLERVRRYTTSQTLAYQMLWVMNYQNRETNLVVRRVRFENVVSGLGLRL